MRRVEKTRGRDPAVSTEAFPLNRVPLCKRQSQFWTGSKTQTEKKKKKLVATSTPISPYAVRSITKSHSTKKRQ